MFLRKQMPTVLHYTCLAFMLVLHFAVPLAHVASTPVRAVGLLLIVAGVAINVAGNNAFRRQNTTNQPLGQPTALVTDGVYRRTRNPQYLGGAVVLAGIALLLGSLAPWVGPIVFVLAVDRAVIRAEEDVLTATFNGPYRAYTRKVRRWL